MVGTMTKADVFGLGGHLARLDELQVFPSAATRVLQVARAADSSLKDMERVFGDEDGRVRAAASANLAAPEASLDRASSDAHWQVRAAVAANPSCSMVLLRTLATDDDWRVRAAVAGNPATPSEVLGALVLDGDAGVRDAAARPAETEK